MAKSVGDQVAGIKKLIDGLVVDADAHKEGISKSQLNISVISDLPSLSAGGEGHHERTKEILVGYEHCLKQLAEDITSLGHLLEQGQSTV